jgi:hypothetical protein
MRHFLKRAIFGFIDGKSRSIYVRRKYVLGVTKLPKQTSENFKKTRRWHRHTLDLFQKKIDLDPTPFCTHPYIPSAWTFQPWCMMYSQRWLHHHRFVFIEFLTKVDIWKILAYFTKISVYDFTSRNLEDRNLLLMQHRKIQWRKEIQEFFVENATNFHNQAREETQRSGKQQCILLCNLIYSSIHSE